MPYRIVFLILLLTAISIQAQWEGRLYPFIELTDEMLAEIDLKDGSVEDWLDVLGEPTLTPLDFATPPSFPKYDPSSFDFRIWLAWHDAGNHLFVAAEMVDDIHVHNEEYWIRHPKFPPTEASVWFNVDADKSGGPMIEFDENGMINRDILMVQAQQYWGVAKNYKSDSNLSLQLLSGEAPWITYVPYADGGGSIVDSRPIFYVVEFYVTPFDRLIWDAPEQSIASDLSVGEQIGFAMAMTDKDSDVDHFMADNLHSLFGPDGSWDLGSDLGWRSDHWAQGILLGPGGRTEATAVESLSWARIKSSLSR